MGLRGKKPGIRYWPSRKGGGYFTTWNGKQTELALGPKDEPHGPTYEKACKAYGRLLCQTEGAGTANLQVEGVRQRYLEWKRKIDPHEALMFEQTTAGFFDRYGDMVVGALVRHHLTDWLDEHRDWSAGYRGRVGKYVMRAFKVGKERGWTPSDPFAGMKMPRGRLRGKEARLPLELCQMLIDECRSAEFRLVLRTLRVTGARPKELFQAEIEDYAKGRITYYAEPGPGKYVWKNAKKTGKDRIVTIPSPLREEIEARIAGRTSGLIFPTKSGRPWSKQNLFEQWKRLMNRPAVSAYLREHGLRRRDVVPYSFRHTFISEWIDAGRSTEMCAELTGTSAEMIRRCYCHMDRDTVERNYTEFMQGRPI